MEKELDGNFARILRAVFNENWKQQQTPPCGQPYLLSSKPSNLDEQYMQGIAGEFKTNSRFLMESHPWTH